MKKTVQCSYHYDPMNRLKGTSPALQSGSLRFYCQSRIATEFQGSTQHSIMQHGDQLLAQQTHQADQHISTLLATDLQRSVLQTTNGAEQPTIAYTPFGHHANENTNTHLLGFNGERADPVTGHYLLGNGYRAFNPVLMRFNSPDSWSPFGEAGINAYAYCMNNPLLTNDPSGHIFKFIQKSFKNFLFSNRRAPMQSYVPGSLNVRAPGGRVVMLKIKPGVSFSAACKARDAMIEHRKLWSRNAAENAIYLNDLKKPYLQKLDLQYLAAGAIKSNNISTGSLPPPLKNFVANTIPNRPHYELITKLKNGNYDPYTQKTGAINLYTYTDSFEAIDYLDSLSARGHALTMESERNYHSILDAHFIRIGG